MDDSILYQAPLWVIFAALLIILPTCSATGYLIGHFFYRKKLAGHGPSTFVPTTVLGLLALMLGFTFSMAVSRFDYRKDVVMKEANSIGSAVLRADMLTEPYRSQFKRLLTEYVDARIAFLEAGVDNDRVKAAQAHTYELQAQMTTLMAALAEKDRSPVMTTYSGVLDNVMSMAFERQYTIEDRVPELVYFIILIIAGVGLGSMGFIRGVAEKKSPWSGSGVLMLTILFAMVITLIQDLDRPRRGWIQINQESFYRLKAELSSIEEATNRAAAKIGH